ncbi:MAG: nuclear transport factor 2 family protein [Chthoniobacterales bacterium]
MIFNPRHVLLIATAAVVFPACAAHADNAPAETANVNSNAGKPVAPAPTTDALLALEKQAAEAYIQGNGKFFAGFLSERFVMREGGARLSKPEVVKRISGVKCKVKGGWTLTEPQLSKIDNDTYVLSYKSNMEGSCTVDGKTEKMPSPVRAVTILARKGQRWQAVFHGENLIVDPKAASTTDKEGEPKKDDNAAANTNRAATSAPANPLTTDLMAAENSVWEAWKNKDAKKVEDLTARDIAFVNIFGTYFANKAEAIKDWTGATCEVTSFTLTDGAATAISPTVGLLTLTGTATGTCGGQDISGQKIYGNSVYVKEGDTWKWAFGFNSPK